LNILGFQPMFCAAAVESKTHFHHPRSHRHIGIREKWIGGKKIVLRRLTGSAVGASRPSQPMLGEHAGRTENDNPLQGIEETRKRPRQQDCVVGAVSGSGLSLSEILALFVRDFLGPTGQSPSKTSLNNKNPPLSRRVFVGSGRSEKGFWVGDNVARLLFEQLLQKGGASPGRS
jgi:hypothetical protein